MCVLEAAGSFVQWQLSPCSVRRGIVMNKGAGEIQANMTLNMHCLLPFPSNLSWNLHRSESLALPCGHFGSGPEMRIILKGRASAVCLAVSAPMVNKKVEPSSAAGSETADEIAQRKWRKMMRDIEASGSAVPVLRSLRIKKQPLPRDLVLGTLVRFKQLKQWKIVSEIIEWLRCQHWWVFSEMDFNMLISAYGKQGDFEKAEIALRSMKRAGFSLNVVTYTALIEAYGMAGQYKKAESILRRMQSSGPEPTLLTYQTMIKLLIEGENFEEAEMIFHGLLDDEKSVVKPDQKMFQMMIYMYKKAGKRDEARQLYGQMVSRGIPLSTITFNSLMSCETNFKETSRIFSQLQRAGFQPDVVSYTLLINAYAKARREEEAQAVFDEMVDAGVRPSRKAYNVLLDAYANSALVEKAKAVFKRMSRDKCRPDLCSYTTLLSAHVNASDMEGAEKIFLRLKRDGIVPNVVTYGTLIKGYAKIDNLDEMMKKYEDMRLQGIKANQTIFTTLMDAHGKKNDFGSAIIWYKEMVASGCIPDMKAKNILYSLAKTTEEKQEVSILLGS